MRPPGSAGGSPAFVKIFVSIFACLWIAFGGPLQSGFAVEINHDREIYSINEAFRSAIHWAGADGAMTVELSPTKILWLFGDTWIAAESKVPLRKMINNSVAIQNSNCDSAQSVAQSWDNICIDSTCWSFCFKGKLETPQSIFSANEPGSYYWPGCGIKYGDKLYLLLKKIRKKDDPSPLFQFDWYAEDVLIVSNPDDAPATWKYTIHPISKPEHQVEFGLACTRDLKYFYSLCYLEQSPGTAKKTILARVPLTKLATISPDDWEYFCDYAAPSKPVWQADFQNAKNIIPDGGPEMSLFFHKGLNCFVSVYQPPLSPIVNLRVASKIEGPWSERVEIFKVPQKILKDGKTTALVYAGKAHESLSAGQTIGFSYCENPGGLEQHIANPGIYFPTVRTYTIATEKVRELLNGAGTANSKP